MGCFLVGFFFSVLSLSDENVVFLFNCKDEHRKSEYFIFEKSLFDMAVSLGCHHSSPEAGPSAQRPPAVTSHCQGTACRDGVTLQKRRGGGGGARCIMGDVVLAPINIFSADK